MEDQTPKSQRRIRYKGTHPKSFKEKYKELQPENFQDDVEKIMQQGRTPAGMHRSICVKEILDFLQNHQNFRFLRIISKRFLRIDG
mgnify:CR=1 FL=1